MLNAELKMRIIEPCEITRENANLSRGLVVHTLNSAFSILNFAFDI